MPSFSDSFWSTGYASGLNVIFDKLRQGCVENDEVLSLAAARADAEEAYGNRLIDIPSSYVVKKNGFGRDDGASLRKAHEGIIDEMANEGKHHVQVAESIRRMVILPFGKWSDDHRKRVDYSSNILRDKLKVYEKELSEVQKAQTRYYNKCRLLEELRNVKGESVGAEVSRNVSDASTFKGVQSSTIPVQPITPPEESAPRVASASATSDASFSPQIPEYDEDPVELGDNIYSPDEARVLFQQMLDGIPRKSQKVSILGTYDNVSTGDAIVSWVQLNMAKDVTTSLSDAEKFGQSLINEGFLRLVGQVGSKFANSSVMNYQWKRKSFEIAGKLEKPSADQNATNLIKPIVGEYLGETINNYIKNPHPDETPDEKLIREVNELDSKYKLSVLKLDDVRCNLEETAIDHLTFMERCEFDRLKAIKAVYLDFLAALSNVIPSIQVSVDKLLLYQETVQPANDLRYVLESYRSGCFSPKVTIYDNYYNTAEDQIFGVELEYRCRGDKKRVPFIVSTILGFMDSKYPEMENDKVRLSAWVVSVPLKTTHELRREINYGGGHPKLMRQLLPKYEPSTIASVVKLYLVELPDSIIPSSLYDVIKSIYSQYGNDEDATNRINAIQNTFGQLRTSNIATLDAIMTHLTRLTTIAKASDEYIGQLAQEFSNCLLRPKAQSALTLGDRHAYLLVKDLINHKDAIFLELRRKNSNRKGSLSPSNSITRKKNENEEPATKIDRRPTLQNRMDALTLKIRKGHGGQDKEQNENHEKQQELGESHLQPIVPPRPRKPSRSPRPVSIEPSTNEQEPAESNIYYDAEQGETYNSPPQQPAGRQDESLTSRAIPVSLEEGGSSHPILID